MQLTTELHVSTLQGYHQPYKINVLNKVPHVPWLIPLFYKHDDGPVGSKHVAQLFTYLLTYLLTYSME